MAYIVTYKKTQEKANEDPDAITYSEFVNVSGVPDSLFHAPIGAVEAELVSVNDPQ